EAIVSAPTEEKKVSEPVHPSALSHPAIECESIVVQFGEISAVQGVSLRVESGDFFGFVGPNGAGKSTTLSVLCTLREPTAGTVRIAGFDRRTHVMEIRRSIGVVFQDPSLDDRLTGRENLLLHARVYGVPRSERK